MDNFADKIKAIAEKIKEGLLTRRFLTFFIILACIFGSFALLDYFRAILDSERLSITLGSFSVSIYKLIRILFVVGLLLWAARTVSMYSSLLLDKLGSVSAGNRMIISKAIEISIYVLLFILGVDFLGIDFKSFAIFSGAVGLGLGFGLQKIAANFISGVILLFENSVKVGDLIQVGNAKLGYVRDVGFRRTLIAAFEGMEVLIPNEELITSHVSNYTHSDNAARVDVQVGVDYSSDLDLVQKILLESAAEYDVGDDAHPPRCFLREFGDNSVNFLLMFWIKDINAGSYGAKSAVMFKIWNSFKKHGIGIPFPQRDLHIKGIVHNSIVPEDVEQIIQADADNQKETKPTRGVKKKSK